MAWAKNGTDTLSGTASSQTMTMNSGYKFNQFLINFFQNAGNADTRFNSNSNSVYSQRYENNNGGDNVSTGDTKIFTGGWDAPAVFVILYVSSIPNKEKLIIQHGMVSGTASGTIYAPNRRESVGKFVPSPDAYITSINTIDRTTGLTLGIGSNLTALTGDETESVTLQDGTIFEETDTNKAYIWSSSSETWTQL